MLPTSSKSLATLITLVPGMSGAPDSGGASGIYRSNAPRLNTYHGKAGIKFSYDGMKTMNLGAAGATSYVMNPATVEEVMVETGGSSAESDASGFVMNMIPKEGGNAFKSIASGFYTNEHFQTNNLTDGLRAQGITVPNTVLYLYDANLTVGGPIKTDRLWFFAATRFGGNKNRVPGVYFNKTQGTPFYTPDLDRPGYRNEHLKSQAGRLTWQVAEKHKVNVFLDVQSMALFSRGDFAAQEAPGGFLFWPGGLAQATWSHPATNKLLFQVGASIMRSVYANPIHPTVKPGDVSIVEASTGFRYNSAFQVDQEWHSRIAQRVSASYVTGSHAIKMGATVEEGIHDWLQNKNEAINYTFLRGVPSSLTQYSMPFKLRSRFMPDMGIFAQDQWTTKRLTLNVGLRFDYFYAYVPPEHVEPTRFIAAARDFPEVKNVPKWTDLNPRLGATYDLFGNGRTALKASFGRYVGAMATQVAEANAGITTSVNNVTRTWNDANGNYIPDCSLTTLTANGECGAVSNSNFGKSNITTKYADDLVRGFGVRDYFWEFGTEIQQQLGPGFSMTGGYYRNWSDHFSATTGIFAAGVTDNLLIAPSDFQPYCVRAPLDSRLPGGGGYNVCGLYDLVPGKFGQVNSLVTRASNYGKDWRQSDFFSLTVNTRSGRGLQMGGGLDTGRTVTDRCYVVDSPQSLLNCRVVAPFKAQTQLKVYGSQRLPAQFMVSGTLQNIAGPEIQATYPATNAEIAPSLGRNLGACGAAAVCNGTATIPLVAPQTLFAARITKLDLRVSRSFKVSTKARLQTNLDVYNVFNVSNILTINSAYGPRWQFPASTTTGAEPLMWGRMIQVGGELTF